MGKEQAINTETLKHTVNHLVYSTDGKSLAFTTQELGPKGARGIRSLQPVVCLYDMPGLKKRAVLQGAGGALAFSPDGKTLASGSGSRNKAVLLWDPATGKELAQLDGHNDYVTALAFSPDGKKLASGNKRGEVIVWDVAARKSLFKFEASCQKILCLAFAPDGDRLVCGSKAMPAAANGGVDNHSGTVWDMKTGKLLISFAPWHNIPCIKFSPDGKLVALGAATYLQLLDTDTWQRWAAPASTTGKLGFINDLAFTPDGKTVITVGQDKMVKLWNVPETKQAIPNDLELPPVLVIKPEQREILRGHSANVHALALSGDGKSLATAAGTNQLGLWQMGKDAPVVIENLDRPVFNVAYAPDGTRLAVASEEPERKGPQKFPVINVYDMPGFKKRFVLEFGGGPMTFSPDGKILATGTGGEEKYVSLWDPATGKGIVDLRGHNGYVTALAFSRDGKKLASGNYRGEVIVWDVAAEKSLFKLEASSQKISSLAFAPDGSTLISASADEPSAKVWDVKTGKLVVAFDACPAIACMSFSPDGKLLALGGSDYLQFLEAVTWERWAAKGGRVTGLAFTPDGKTVVTVGSGSVVQLWDVPQAKEAISKETKVRPVQIIKP